jgi:predicted membrane chloride channel (bestrophin family)
MDKLTFQNRFTEIAGLIKKSRYKALQAVNSELMNLYWQIGEYICKRIESEGWGKSVVVQLADYLQKIYGE